VDTPSISPVEPATQPTPRWPVPVEFEQTPADDTADAWAARTAEVADARTASTSAETAPPEASEAPEEAAAAVIPPTPTDDSVAADEPGASAEHDEEGPNLGALPGLDRVRHLFGRKRE
jgi:hypothetical protein